MSRMTRYLRVDTALNGNGGATSRRIYEVGDGGKLHLRLLAPCSCYTRDHLMWLNNRREAWITPEEHSEEIGIPMGEWSSVIGYTTAPQGIDAPCAIPEPGLHPVYEASDGHIYCLKEHAVRDVHEGEDLEEIMLVD